MKVILTHVSRTAAEILEVIIQAGSFTAPLGLPQYRYDNTRRNCYMLEDAKVIKRSNKHGIQVHYTAGDNLGRWISEGKPPLNAFCRGIAKERKAANPPKLKKKTCRGCGCEFETRNPHQKRCVRGCKPKIVEGK